MKISPPAFPTYLADNIAHGMSLRDYFAAAAMPLAYKYWMEDYYHPNSSALKEDGENKNSPRDFFNENVRYCIALSSYDMADAMIKAREE